MARTPRAATHEKRERILDAAARLMIREGYAAVTSRRVEAEAGIKPHYHFGTLDDLFVALVHRIGESNVGLLADALASDQPLRAWWDLVSDSRGNILLVELTAAGNHRPALQAEMATFARDVRQMQIDTLGPILAEYGIDPELYPAALVTAMVQGFAFVMAHDRAAGFETHQDEAVAAFERLVDHLEATRAAAGTVAKRSRPRSTRRA